MTDGDYGILLTGASSILVEGRWPFIHFYSNWGPATYGVVVPFLLAERGAFLALVIAIAIANAASLVLLFAIARRLCGDSWIALLVAASGALFPVRAFYFWKPLLALASYALLTEKLLGRRLEAAVFGGSVGALCGIGFLFRPDLGVYMLGAAGAAFLGLPASERLRAFAAFAAGAAVAVTPWICLLVQRDAMRGYLDQLAYSVFAEPLFNSLPHPFTLTRGPSLAAAYGVLYATVATAWATVAAGQARRDARWFLLLANVIMATWALPYSLTFSGQGHFASSLWLALPLLPQIYHAWPGARLAWTVAIAALLSGGWHTFPPRRRPRLDAGRWPALVASPTEFAERFGGEEGHIIRAANACTTPGDRVVAFAEMPWLPFFAERKLAGRYLMHEHGFYLDSRFQAQGVAELDARPPALVVERLGAYQIGYVFDWARQARHELLREWLERRMTPVLRARNTIFYAPVARRAELAHCLTAFYALPPRSDPEEDARHPDGLSAKIGP